MTLQTMNQALTQTKTSPSASIQEAALIGGIEDAIGRFSVLASDNAKAAFEAAAARGSNHIVSILANPFTDIFGGKSAVLPQGLNKSELLNSVDITFKSWEDFTVTAIRKVAAL